MKQMSQTLAPSRFFMDTMNIVRWILMCWCWHSFRSAEKIAIVHRIHKNLEAASVYKHSRIFYHSMPCKYRWSPCPFARTILFYEFQMNYYIWPQNKNNKKLKIDIVDFYALLWFSLVCKWLAKQWMYKHELNINTEVIETFVGWIGFK